MNTSTEAGRFRREEMRREMEYEEKKWKRLNQRRQPQLARQFALIIGIVCLGVGAWYCLNWIESFFR